MNLAGTSGVTFSFGDSPAMADELLALVLAGTKTATCGALTSFGPSEPMPEAGRRDLVLDGSGNPAAIIETQTVKICRFDEVDADFARDEGEGDGTLEFWRDAHRAYFERNGGWSASMMVVCERFRLIEILPRAGRGEK